MRKPTSNIGNTNGVKSRNLTARLWYTCGIIVSEIRHCVGYGHGRRTPLASRAGRITGIFYPHSLHIHPRFGKSYIRQTSSKDSIGSSDGSPRTSRPLPMMIPCAKCCIWRRQKLSNTGLPVVEIGIKSSASWTSYLATGLPGKSPPLICGSNHNLYAVFLSIGKSYLHKKFRPTLYSATYSALCSRHRLAFFTRNTQPPECFAYLF